MTDTVTLTREEAEKIVKLTQVAYYGKDGMGLLALRDVHEILNSKLKE